jgi:hypothetical protein
MSSWIESFPKTVSKNDLRGKPLKILADSPPSPSNKSGILQLKVFCTEDSKTFIVLVTGQDINRIIDIADKTKGQGNFTFDKSEPWAEVIEYGTPKTTG